MIGIFINAVLFGGIDAAISTSVCINKVVVVVKKFANEKQISVTLSFYLLENLGINMAESTHFYPYGSGVGDSIGEKQHEDATGKIPISTSFVLYGTSFNDLWVRTFV